MQQPYNHTSQKANEPRIVTGNVEPIHPDPLEPIDLLQQYEQNHFYTRPQPAYQPRSEQSSSYTQGYAQQAEQPDQPFSSEMYQTRPPQYQSQQQYQFYAQVPYAQPAITAGSWPVQEAGVDGRILAAGSYLGFWLTGLIIALFVRENRFVRFHALQSALFYGAINVIWITYFWMIYNLVHYAHMRFLPVALTFVFIIINIIAAIGWFVGVMGALSGKYSKLPFVGDRCERLVGKKPFPFMA